MFLKKLKQNTVKKLINIGIDSKEASIESEILLNFVFGVTKKDMILNPEIILEEEKLETFNNLIDRRIKKRIPLQYLTNKAYFMGEEFYVDENVLIPRPETEILVEEVACHSERNERISKIIDIGTGSGCIACMLAKKLENAEIFASDISEKALKVAEKNAEKLGVKNKIIFINSNIFENIDEKEKFDVIVSNPPYIPILEKQNLQPEVALHEPHQALFIEDTKGISFYEKLAAQSKNRLAEKGILAVEIGINQLSDIVHIFKEVDFKEIKAIKDLNKMYRIIIGR